jgi:hypothetical protein
MGDQSTAENIFYLTCFWSSLLIDFFFRSAFSIVSFPILKLRFSLN